MPKLIARTKADKLQNKAIRRLEKKVNQQETKVQQYSNYNPTDGTNIDLSTAAQVYDIADIAQGDAASQRTGDKIAIQHLSHDITMSNGAAAPNVVRYVLFHWKGDTAPGLSDVVNMPAAATGVCTAVMNPVVPRNRMDGNLKVLVDRMFYLEGTALASGDRLKTIRIQKRFKNGSIDWYNGAASGTKYAGLYYVLFAGAGGVGTITINDCLVTHYTDA